jgi:hypothetical protein
MTSTVVGRQRRRLGRVRRHQLSVDLDGTDLVAAQAGGGGRMVELRVGVAVPDGTHLTVLLPVGCAFAHSKRKAVLAQHA